MANTIISVAFILLVVTSIIVASVEVMEKGKYPAEVPIALKYFIYGYFFISAFSIIHNLYIFLSNP